MARQGRFELPAYGLEVRCSIQLSYWRITKTLSSRGGLPCPAKKCSLQQIFCASYPQKKSLIPLSMPEASLSHGERSKMQNKKMQQLKKDRLRSRPVLPAIIRCTVYIRMQAWDDTHSGNRTSLLQWIPKTPIRAYTQSSTVSGKCHHDRKKRTKKIPFQPKPSRTQKRVCQRPCQN